MAHFSAGCHTFAQFHLPMQISNQNSLPSNISARFISHLSRNRQIRGAGRLFVVIRHKIGSVYHPDNADQKAILLQFFSVNQIQRYSKLLVQHKLARRNTAGSIFLTKISAIVPDAFNKQGKRIKTRHVEIPDWVLKNGSDWSNYVCGIDWADLAWSMKYSKGTKRKALNWSVEQQTRGTVLFGGRVMPAQQLVQSADSRHIQGVSNGIYAGITGVHKSTASRRRKKGAIGGVYQLARWFEDMTVRITDWHVELIRHAGMVPQGCEKHDLNAVVFVDGSYRYETVCQIVMPDIFARSKRKK